MVLMKTVQIFSLCEKCGDFMAEYPFASVSITPKDETLPLFKEYAWDFEKDCFLYDGNGKHILLEGNEALRIWCCKALKTERFMYLAYTHGFGIELYPFMAKVMGVLERKSEMKRMLTVALIILAQLPVT